MDTTIFVGMSYQKALRRKMDVIAHNVANMNTTAFKLEKVAFRQHLTELEGGAATDNGKVSYVLDHGIVRNLEQGKMIQTGGQLDVYIEGPGYLALEGKNGEILYSRNGRLQVGADDFLRNSDGLRVLDYEGLPIEIPDATNDVAISRDGTITAGTRAPVKLGLYTFKDEQSMNRIGGSLYKTDQEAIPPGEDGDQVIVRQFALEGSNVNSIKSIVEMMEVMRSYQGVSKNMDEYQRLREESLDRLARVQG